MTEIGSFIRLLHSCREHEPYLSPTLPTTSTITTTATTPPTTSTTTTTATTPTATTPPSKQTGDGFYLLESEDIVSIEVPFHLPSLFSSSRVVSFMLDVFSEGNNVLGR